MALGSGRVSALSREIKLGDRVLLYQDVRRKWIAKVEPGRFHTHRGYFELAELVGREYGGGPRATNGPKPAALQTPPPLIVRPVFYSPPYLLREGHRVALFSLGVRNGGRVGRG